MMWFQCWERERERKTVAETIARTALNQKEYEKEKKRKQSMNISLKKMSLGSCRCYLMELCFLSLSEPRSACVCFFKLFLTSFFILNIFIFTRSYIRSPLIFAVFKRRILFRRIARTSSLSLRRMHIYRIMLCDWMMRWPRARTSDQKKKEKKINRKKERNEKNKFLNMFDHIVNEIFTHFYHKYYYLDLKASYVLCCALRRCCLFCHTLYR